jgi:hypothetical protein
MGTHPDNIQHDKTEVFNDKFEKIDTNEFINTIDSDDQKDIENILHEAERLIYGDRPTEYDHPRNDFTRTGRMWGAILSGHFKKTVPDISPEIVGLMMVAVKLSRESYKHKRDNVVDGAGYWGCVDRVLDSCDLDKKSP